MRQIAELQAQKHGRRAERFGASMKKYQPLTQPRFIPKPRQRVMTGTVDFLRLIFFARVYIRQSRGNVHGRAALP